MQSSFVKALILILFLSSCATTYNPDIDYNPEFNFSQLQTFVVLDDLKQTNKRQKV